MVTTFFPPHTFGGDGIHVHRLSNELARRGHDVTVAYPPDAYRLFRDHPRSGAPAFEPGVTIVPLRGRAGRAGPVSTYLTGRPALQRTALRTVLDRSYDVIHFHNVSLAGGAGVLGYGRGTKLYTLNEHWLVCPMHVLWKQNREPCREPQCVRCQLAFRRPPQLWRAGSLLERSTRKIDVFLAPSHFTMDEHRRRGFDRRMRHLPHFLPRSDAPPGSAGDAARRPYFLVVARLERLKAVDRVVDAFRRYDAADLVVVGNGEEEVAVRKRAAGLRHVRFLGWQPQSALPDLYAGATALIVPSAGYEVFGLVVVEAFAQGTPAIVHDIGALPELIEQSDGGYTYRTEDELVAALDRLRRDHALRDRLGENGRAAWSTRWSEDPHIDAYFEAIAEAREGSAT